MSVTISKTHESTYFMDAVCVTPVVGQVFGALTVASNVVKVAWDAFALLILAFRRLALGSKKEDFKVVFLEDTPSEDTPSEDTPSESKAKYAFNLWKSNYQVARLEKEESCESGSSENNTTSFDPTKHDFSYEGSNIFLDENEIEIFKSLKTEDRRADLTKKIENRGNDLGRELLFILFGIIRMIPVANIILPSINYAKCLVLNSDEKNNYVGLCLLKNNVNNLISKTDLKDSNEQLIPLKDLKACLNSSKKTEEEGGNILEEEGGNILNENEHTQKQQADDYDPQE